ncbi:hypothetical protein F8B91_04285 [Aestuariivirga litoralis]|nr:hypothetical protein [Aestuariivirga litoralis]
MMLAANDAVPATLVAAAGALGAIPAPVGSDATPAPLVPPVPVALDDAVIKANAAGSAAGNIYSETSSDKIGPSTALPRVYVPNHSSNTVTVIDMNSKKVIETYKVGRGPQHVVPSFDKKTLWVNNTADGSKMGSVTPIDPTTGKPGTEIAVDDPYNMYFTPDGKLAIVVAEAYRRLDLRDAQTMALVSSIPTPTCEGLNHADYNADFSEIVFTCEFGGVVSGRHGQMVKTEAHGEIGPSLIKVDLKSGTVSGELVFSKPGMPQDVRLSPDGKTFYVTDMMNDGVFLVDAATFNETGFIFTGKGAHGLNVSRDGKSLYVANRGSNRMPDRHSGPGSVSVINFATNAVEHTWLIPGGGSPDMGNVTPDGKELWLAGRYDGEVYAIDTSNGAVTKINVGIEPHGLTVWPQVGRFSLGHTGNMR